MGNAPVDVFRANGGQLRMSEAIERGITRYMLYALKDRGVIEQVSRGVYRLTELPAISNPDLVTVSLRFPKAIVCLVSALSFHRLTTQIPHAVALAFPKTSRLPSLDYPPIKAHRFADSAYMAGVWEHRIDGVAVKVYCPEKTLADCFKFRNKVGMDVVLEALKCYSDRKQIAVNELLGYARICRVERLMLPYLEAIL